MGYMLLVNMALNRTFFSYLHGTTSDDTLHTTERACMVSSVHNSITLNVSSFWNGKRSHFLVGPFRNVLEWQLFPNSSVGNGPVHTVINKRSRMVGMDQTL